MLIAKVSHLVAMYGQLIQIFQQLVQGQRTAVIETLNVLAPARQQKLQLFHLLHPLYDHRHIQVMN